MIQGQGHLSRSPKGQKMVKKSFFGPEITQGVFISKFIPILGFISKTHHFFLAFQIWLL